LTIETCQASSRHKRRFCTPMKAGGGMTQLIFETQLNEAERDYLST
jgi:hypothetical protein